MANQPGQSVWAEQRIPTKIELANAPDDGVAAGVGTGVRFGVIAGGRSGVGAGMDLVLFEHFPWTQKVSAPQQSMPLVHLTPSPMQQVVELDTDV